MLSVMWDAVPEAIDAGPQRVSRLLEPYPMLWIHLAMTRHVPTDTAFARLGRESLNRA
jgi:hypothetical protein